MRSLTVEDIDSEAESYKSHLQGEVNRKIRQKDVYAALAILEGMEFVDGFAYRLRLLAGSQLHAHFKRSRHG